MCTRCAYNTKIRTLPYDVWHIRRINALSTSNLICALDNSSKTSKRSRWKRKVTQKTTFHFHYGILTEEIIMVHLRWDAGTQITRECAL